MVMLWASPCIKYSMLVVEPPWWLLGENYLWDLWACPPARCSGGVLKQGTGQVRSGVGKLVSLSVEANVFEAEMGGNVCKRKFI